MRETSREQVRLRPATEEDCKRLWEWRNEPEVRQASFDTNFLPYEDHQRWFAEKIQADDTHIYIILDNHDREIGYVRYRLERDQAEISVGLDPSQRGKGYGSAAIRKGSSQILTDGLAQKVVAYVKRENPASVNAFLKAGFADNGLASVAGTQAHLLVYEHGENHA